MLHALALLLSLLSPRKDTCCDCPPCPACAAADCCADED